MGKDKHEKNRVTGSRSRGKKEKYLGPPEGEAWTWMTREMLESPPFRALSGNGRKVIDRLMIEHASHAGTNNGKLICTYCDFIDYGIRKSSISAALNEVEYMGFISIDRGKSYKGEHEPNLYRITWFGDLDGAPPTNNWKSIDEPHIQVFKERKKEEARLLKMKKTATQNNVVHLASVL